MRFALLALVLLSASAAAQEPEPTTKPSPTTKPAESRPKPLEPTHDEKALAAFHAMTAKVYRPRTDDLEAVDFVVTVESLAWEKDKKDEARSRSFGPFQIHWDAKGTTAKNEDGTPASLDARALDKLVGDLIGVDSSDLLAANSLKLDDDGRILIGPPVAKGEKFVPASILELDEKGRLSVQHLCHAGVSTFERHYFYRTRGDDYLVQRIREQTVTTDVRILHTYVDIAGFTFPSEIKASSEREVAGGRMLLAENVTTFTQIVPTRKPAAKEPASRPTDN